MADDRDHGKRQSIDDAYRVVGILANKVQNKGAPSSLHHVPLPVGYLQVRAQRLVENEKPFKMQALKEKIAMELSQCKCSLNEPYCFGLVDPQDIPKDKTYADLLDDHLKSNIFNYDMTKDFIRDILEPAYERNGREILEPLNYYTDAFIAEELRRDPLAYTRYLVAGSNQEQKQEWQTTPELDRWITSGGAVAPFVGLLGDPGTGKTTVEEIEIERALRQGKWVFTSLPVVDDPKLHLWHVEHLEDLFRGKIPNVADFQIWKHERQTELPYFNSNIVLVVDERKRIRSSSSEADWLRETSQKRRHYEIAVLTAGVNEDDPLIENLYTELWRTGKTEDKHWIEDHTAGHPHTRLYPQKLEQPIFEYYAKSIDQAPPFSWFFELTEMESYLSQNAKGADWDGIKNAMTEFFEEQDELASEEAKDPIPAVAICPECNAEKPFNSKKPKSMQCRECKAIFKVDPIRGENWEEVDENHKPAKPTIDKNSERAEILRQAKNDILNELAEKWGMKP